MAEIVETLRRSSKSCGGLYRARCPECRDIYVTTGFPGELARRPRCIGCAGLARVTGQAKTPAERQRAYCARQRMKRAAAQ